MTVEEVLVRQARLWNSAAVSRMADEWLKGEGSFFLELKGNQVHGLAGEVWKATERNTFLKKALSFTRACEKRGAAWEEETIRSLCLGMCRGLQAAREVRKVANRGFDPNAVFNRCIETLPEPQQSHVRRERDLLILRDYFSAIMRGHRAFQQRREVTE